MPFYIFCSLPVQESKMLILIMYLALMLSFVGGISAFYWSFLKSKNYWKNKKVAYKEPKLFVGNFGETGTKNLGIIFRDLYEEAKKEKFFGIWQFTQPVLLIIDLELIKRILIADFSHFDDHGVYSDEQTDPLSVNLLTMGGASWRNLRTKLNPAFTAGKLKAMFPMVVACGEELARVIRDSAEKQEVVEFKDLFARYTTDVISSCAFGLETHSLKNENSHFRIIGKKVFEPSWEVIWRNFLGYLFPEFAKFFKIRIYPKVLTEFFIRVIRETMCYRESSGFKRNDILQMLIQLKNEGFIQEVDSETASHMTNESEEKDRPKFTHEQAAAQAFIFFTAGFETSSTTMQYALYELAMNPGIQEKTRNEIQEVLSKRGGSLTYDALQEMSYLSRVLDETLRKYPPATNLSRVCTKEYQIPGTDIILEKGTQVSVSVLGLHWDDRYYPDPGKFDPDRFTEQRKSSRLPCTYMPFGEGPRTCIGQRFGLTQAKVGLISIISNYEVSVSESKTRIPPIYDPKSFFSAPKGGMHLKVSLLKQSEPNQ